MPDVPIIPEDEISKGTSIGAGGSATVNKGKWRGTSVALRQFNKVTLVGKRAREEVSLHAHMRHPNILMLYGVCETQDSFLVIAELMDCSLDKVIFRKTRPTKKQALSIGEKIVSGVVHLHENKVVHGDMKPPNVLVSKDFSQVKVCDFGLSRIKESATVTQINVVPGTFLYMAPESLFGRCEK